VLLVLDQAYLEFLDEPADFLPSIREGRQENLLLMRTFSKIYGLAGLRVGYGIGTPDLVGALEKVRQPFNLNAVALAGALAALDDEPHLLETHSNNRRGLALLEEGLGTLGLEFIPSYANFVLVRVGDGAHVFSELQRRGVITRPMGGYQLPEWIRVTVGTERENRRCLESLREVLARP
jgi:histidinol-phosphate aminotransferase